MYLYISKTHSNIFRIQVTQSTNKIFNICYKFVRFILDHKIKRPKIGMGTNSNYFKDCFEKKPTESSSCKPNVFP